MQIKAYRASTTQKHGGKVFLAGATIPAEYIPPFSAQKLLSIGVITETVMEVETEGGQKVSFPVLSGGNIEDVETTAENLYNALIVVQKTPSEAEAVIAECESADVLLMVEALDKRKPVQTAIANRKAALEELGDE